MPVWRRNDIPVCLSWPGELVVWQPFYLPFWKCELTPSRTPNNGPGAICELCVVLITRVSCFSRTVYICVQEKQTAFYCNSQFYGVTRTRPLERGFTICYRRQCSARDTCLLSSWLVWRMQGVMKTSIDWLMSLIYQCITSWNIFLSKGPPHTGLFEITSIWPSLFVVVVFEWISVAARTICFLASRASLYILI